MATIEAKGVLALKNWISAPESIGDNVSLFELGDRDGIDNVSGGSTGTLYSIFVDNSQDSANVAIWLAVWDLAAVTSYSGSPSGYGVAPLLLLPIAANSTKTFNFPEGIAFTTGLSVAITKDNDASGKVGASTPAFGSEDVYFGMNYT